MPGFRSLLLLLLWGLSCAALAQVYKSTDAEGNVVFSDTPTESGEEVKIPELNVADPVETPVSEPPPPAVETAPEPEVTREQPPLEGISGEMKRDKSGKRRKPRVDHIPEVESLN